MNNLGKLMLGVLLLLGVAVAGYWFGTHAAPGAKETTSPAKAERKALYYRNPMGLPDTSPAPKKDAMGMDYVPVYAGDAGADDSHTISISVEKIQKLGVKSEAAELRELDKTLRMAGRIEIDERRIYTIAPKFEGWVERLYVNATGQHVVKGQPLFDVYSPELVSAQREHALAVQGLAALENAGDDAKQSMQQLADASSQRLKNWNIAEGEINRERVTYRAPVNGIVLEKKALQGMRFMPGEVLYQIADLSAVWVIAEVPEQDIGQVQPGSRTQVMVNAYPDRTFPGRVDFIYPTLNSATRTVQVRVEIANPDGLLKPAMFAQVEMAGAGKGKVLAVPASAVIDSGMRQIVLVRLAEGRFEPREVRLGSRSDKYVEVLGGIAAGEQVVVSANFLIDAESNLKAALSGMVHAPGADASQGNLPADAAHAGHEQVAMERPKSIAVGHQAQGTLDSINANGTVSITHGPIKTLGWPGMSMDFALANPALAAGIEPGSLVDFEIVERKPGEWVITKLQVQHRHEGH